MPKVENRFAGHMETGDPRSPVFAAGGCTWPTVPALKYRAQSDNASGSLSQLDGNGLLLPLITFPHDHDVSVWQFTAATGDIEFINATKFGGSPFGPGYKWRIDIKIRGDFFIIIKEVLFPTQKCNVDVHIGNIVARGPSVGETGDTFAINQVEWDQVLPPD